MGDRSDELGALRGSHPVERANREGGIAMDRTAAVKRLEPLVGEWSIEVALGPEPVPARMRNEWALDGQYVLQRSEVEHPLAPNGLMVIAPHDDGEGYTQHYFDSRGVVRLYEMT